jgi:serine/threonine protein kinase
MTARLSHREGDLFGNGQYRIAKRLKMGGMGTVYQAVNTRTNTLYAVKECDLLDDPRGRALGRSQAVRIFLNEAAGIEQLDHPGIPRGHLQVDEVDLQLCLQCGNRVEGASCDICLLEADSLFYQPQQVEQRYYLLMEYIEGADLSEVAASFSRPLSRAQAGQVLDWIAATVDILSYLNEQQLAHCDIKPENLRIRSADARLFLLDFGLLRLDQGQASPSAGTQTRVLGGDTLKLGTEGYAPPEQVSGRPVFASDRYALAMTTLNLLTGLDPANPVEKDRLRATDPAVLVPELTPRAAALLHGSLAVDPQARPALDQWRDVLAGDCFQDPALVRPAPPVLPGAAGASRAGLSLKPLLKWGAVAVVALLLVAGLFYGIRFQQRVGAYEAAARPQSVVYKRPAQGKILQRLEGGERLLVKDAGTDEGYWLRIVAIDDVSARGFIQRRQIDIIDRRER